MYLQKKMLEGVVTDEKSLRLCLCKKKEYKKFKKLLHSLLQYPSSCSIRFSPVLLRVHGKNGFIFSCQCMEQPFALHSFVAGHFFLIKQQKTRTVLSC